MHPTEIKKEIKETPKQDNSIFLKATFFIIGIVFIFYILSNSIVEIKLLELKFYVNKEQLFNYELSSKVLREKIKNILISKDDYISELRSNILESSVMNSLIEEDLSISLHERVGLLVVNLVRIITFNETLNFIEDRKYIYQIQFAFYMERTKKFSLAIKKYEELTTVYKRSNTFENGFVLLHLGYCYAMIGNTNLALQKLYITEDIFKGTQFAEYSRILINVLLENDRRGKEIDNLAIPLSEKADLFYETGRYSDSLAALNKIENRNSKENFVRARSLEELGSINEATGEYIKLIEKKDDRSISIKANRRVLMIGTIYENNKDLTEYAKQNANSLGDKEFVKTVENASTLVQRNKILEKISMNETDPKTETNDESLEFAELKQEFETVKIEKNKESEALKTFINTVINERRTTSPPILVIRFIDGRIISGEKLEFSAGNLIISDENFPIILPNSNIEEISIENKQNNKEYRIKIIKDYENISGVKKIINNPEGMLAISESGNTKINDNSSFYIIIEEFNPNE
jgi:tetratricopeptide (TPR) repeat protein